MRVRIYTDGSYDKDSKIGSWAYIICRKKYIESKTNSQTKATNNKMELRAVIEALNVCLKENEKDIEIFTDSAYVYNCIKNQQYLTWVENNWKTVKGYEIKNSKEWKELIRLLCMFEDANVEFVKIKAHSNNTLNDKVDKICKNELKNTLKKLRFK